MVRCDEDGAEMLSTRDISDLYDCHMRDGDEVTRARLILVLKLSSSKQWHKCSLLIKSSCFSHTMNDSGIFDDGQLALESSVIRIEGTRPEAFPPVPGLKRRKTVRANNKKRRKYEEVHIDHNYALPHLTPDEQFEYLFWAQTKETNGDMRLQEGTANPLLGEDSPGDTETAQGLEAQTSSPGLGGGKGINRISGITFSRQSSVEKVKRRKC